MNDIRLEYTDGTVLLDTKIASGWNDFTKTALLAFVRLMDHPVEKAQPIMLFFLMKISRLQYSELDPNYIRHLYPHIDFVFKKDRIRLKKSLVKRIGILTGPGDRMKNYTIEQYGFVETFLRAYQQSEQDQSILNDLLSVAYSLPVIGFKKKLTDITFWIFRHLVSKNIKMAALINLIGLDMKIKDDHPHLWSEKSSGGKSDGFGWLGVLQDISGSKFGSFSETEKTPLHVALAYMERLGIQRKEVEIQLEIQKLKNKHGRL